MNAAAAASSHAQPTRFKGEDPEAQRTSYQVAPSGVAASTMPDAGHSNHHRRLEERKRSWQAVVRGVARYANAIVAVVALVCAWIALQFAIWLAKKGFMEHCLSDQARGAVLDEACSRALDQASPQPPLLGRKLVRWMGELAQRWVYHVLFHEHEVDQHVDAFAAVIPYLVAFVSSVAVAVAAVVSSIRGINPIASLPSYFYRKGSLTQATRDVALVDEGTEKIEKQGSESVINIHHGKGGTFYIAEKMTIVKEDDEWPKILKWLSETMCLDHHHSVSSNRLEGTGQWLLQRKEFLDWRETTSPSILWLHGIAGAGKSMLMSLVVDEFLEDMEEDDALVYFYCKYDEFERRNPESILRALVKQLTLASSQPPEPVASIYEQRRTGGFLSGPLTLEESKRLLVELISSFRQTVICIDALDECDKNTRKQLLDVLTDLLRLSSRPVKIYVTSRDDDDIVLHLDVFPNISIRSHDTSADIEYFVHTEIEKRIANTRLLRGNVDPELKSHIKSTLCSRASGMFLWVHFQILNICNEKTTTSLKKALNRLPADLRNTFLQILKRIEEQSDDSRALAERTLKFILCAQRPPTPDELTEFLCFDPTERTFDDNGLNEMVILDLCQNFVVKDNESNVLRFTHTSVHDFLQGEFGLPAAHTFTAEMCLSLLCLPNSFDDEDGPDEATITGESILDYASTYWAKHVRSSGNESDSSLIKLQEEFLQPSPAYTAWLQKSISLDTELSNGWNILAPLFVVCYYGLAAMCQHLLDTGCDPNMHNAYRRTALHAAARYGHEALVQKLVGLPTVDLNAKDNDGITPLSWAARRGHDEVVRQILTAKGVDVNAKDRSGRTPLLLAVQHKHRKVVGRLLETDGVDVNCRDDLDWTPLSFAAESGDLKLVDLLLSARGLDVNSGDYDGWTPLLFAAEQGHERVTARLLRATGIDVNAGDDEGRAPLSFASKLGYEGVVRLLLDAKGIDIRPEDSDGKTPLLWAIQNQNERLVRQLLRAERVDMPPGHVDWAELVHEAERGHEAVIRLIRAGARNEQDTNNPGSISLSFAAKQGYDEVRRLLEAGLDVNSKDKPGLTLLSRAAGCGNELLVEKLLGMDGIAVGSTDNGGRTALSWAARLGHDGVIRRLLRAKGVDVNCKDNGGRTPLLWAAQKNHRAAVMELLKAEGVDFDSSDHNGLTPLSWAAMRGYSDVVELLLGTGTVDFNAEDRHGLTPILWAAKEGKEAVLQQLLDIEAVDLDFKDKDGLTPLSWAALQGHEETVRLLLNAGANFAAQDNNGQTALSLAKENDYRNIVRMLQLAGADKP